MPTHYLSSSTPINLYVTDSVYFTNIPSNTVVTVLEEGVGTNCRYNLVRIDEPSLIRYYNNEYFVLTDSVYPLDGTAESAPHVCIMQSEYDSNYEPPQDWYNVVNTPFLNKKDQTYYITVVSNYKTLELMELLKQEAVKEGTKRILEFCFRDSSEQTLDKVLKYYKFTNFVQYYVPFEPNLRIKCQISIPRKYVDVMEVKQIDVSTSTSTIGYYLKDVSTKIQKVSDLLEQYHKDMVFYNVKIKDINLSNDAKWLRSFRENLQTYFVLNNITTLSKRGFVEFSIDNCYNIKNVSYCNEKDCSYVKTGLSQLFKTAPFNNPSVVNLIAQLDAISQIRYCDTPWYDFLNMFYYPKQNIAPMQNPLDKFNNLLTGKFNSMIQIPSDVSNMQEIVVQLNAAINLTYGSSQNERDLAFEDQLFQSLKEILLSYRNNLVIVAGSKVVTSDGIKEYLSNFNSNNIVEKLKQIKLCELSLQAMECLGQLVPVSVVEETHISFTYQQQKQELIPFLTVEEKKILFRKILNDKSINRQTINKLINKFEKNRVVLHSIRKQTYDQLIETLINYMVS